MKSLCETSPNGIDLAWIPEPLWRIIPQTSVLGSLHLVDKIIDSAVSYHDPNIKTTENAYTRS
jgi:hypothetical protein